MDFDVKEETEEEKIERKDKNNKKILIIIIVFALIVGLIVFFAFNASFNKKTKKPKVEPPTSQKLSLTESNVKILYDYVTYSATGIRYDKFIKEKKTSLKTFTNEEKFIYALQFAKASDFSKTGEVDEDGEAEYLITSRKIKTYMERFFGSKVTYTDEDVIKYQFEFTKNDIPVDVSTLKYSSELKGYVTTFKYKNGYEPKEKTTDDGNEKDELDDSGVVKEEKELVLVEPYYTKLYAAYKEQDGSYRLEEKIIYTTLEQDGDTYTVSIYADYDKSKLLETKANQTKEMLLSNPITMGKYIDKASTITYYFKLNKNVLYFDSSKIN